MSLAAAHLLKSSFLRQTINRHCTRFLSSNNYVLDSGVPDIDIPNLSVSEVILPQFKHDHLIASECGLSGRKYTFADVRSKSTNLGKNLRKKLNLNENDVVAVLLPNVPEYCVTVLGIVQAGLVVTTLNPIYTAEELTRQIKDSSAKAVITLDIFWDITQSVNKLLQSTLPTITIRSKQADSLPRQAIDFNEFADSSVDFPEFTLRKPDDLAFLPYSSGTTGLPKGVELTHKNIVSQLFQNDAPHVQFFRDTPNTGEQDIIPAVLPQFHIYGLTILTLITLYKQSKTVTLPKFVPNDYVNVLKQHKPNILFVVPPLVLFLTASLTVTRETLSCIENVMCGAAPLGALDEERFIAKVGKEISILQGYGLSETSPVVTTTTREWKKSFKNISGTIGRALPNTQLKVINPDDPKGTPLGPKQNGELLVKGPQVMKGYHNKPEETEKTFLDGWLRTGDMVYYNEDGFLFVTDRLKELIKVKGFQVAPAELEEIIRNYPNVEDAAVVGVPHDKYGEVPRAFIVAKKDTQINTDDLDQFVSSKVAEYKRLLGGIEVTNSIPKNASGKILRRELKLKYIESQK